MNWISPEQDMKDEVRISNWSYAVVRLVGLVSVLAATGGIVYMATLTDASWYEVSFAIGFMVALTVWSGYAATSAAWSVRLTREVVRIRYLLKAREYSWEEIEAAELRDEITYIMRDVIDVPLFKHKALKIRTKQGRHITIILGQDAISAV